MAFWKRTKPTPWYRKVWDQWSNLLVSLTTVIGALGSAYAYVAVDTTSFVKTTDIYAAADQRNLYVQMDVISGVNEQTFVTVTLDGQQVKSLIFPNGITKGEYVMEIGIPFTSDDLYLDVYVEVTVVGVRTLFIPENFGLSLDVEKQGGTNENTNNTTSRITDAATQRGYWV